MIDLGVVLFRSLPATAMLTTWCAASALAEQTPGEPYGAFVAQSPKELPNVGRPQTKVGFPVIRDWNSLKIALQRTVCFGKCPAYTVEISGDGTVRYHGLDFVAITGQHEAHIPADNVRALWDAFVKADFFWTFDEYRAGVTDLPTYRVSISFDDKSKTVVDYDGREIGMPNQVSELENAIDVTANTKKWVEGVETTELPR